MTDLTLLPQAMTHLAPTVEDLAEVRETDLHSLSANTRRCYASDVRLFQRWCAEHGYTSLPAQSGVAGV